VAHELDRLQKQAKGAIARLKHTQTVLNNNSALLDDHLRQVGAEYHRIAEISHNAPTVIENIDKQFKEKTKLSDSDVHFLLLCTALQCARQYLLTNDKFRLTAVQGDRLMSDTVGTIVPPTWEDILFQSVPYDALKTSAHITDTGLSGTTHRYRTLGHDPVLGWIFGTANIMTNALTKTDFITTYQVSNMTIIRHYPMGTMGMLEKAANYAQNDPMLLSAAVARQAIHLGSDYFTKQGLPIPLIATVNNDLAKTMLTKGRIDMWSITRGAVLAALVNQLIAMIHRLFYNESKDGSETMYEIRTRKILSYSNALAVGSNVVVTAFTKDLTKLDVGGILVALHRFISDYQFIQAVKRDFLKNEIYNMVVGKPYDFIGG